MLGLALRALVDGPLAKYGGVALWSCALYAFVLLVWPRLPLLRAILLVVALSFAVELVQLSDGPRHLASRHVLFRLLLGTTFHGWDLPWYLVGTLVFSSVHAWLLRASRRRMR